MSVAATTSPPSRQTLSKNDTSERQMQQMIAFVKTEAREKAEEIEQKTEAEFQADKANKIRILSRVIREEAERKRKEKTIVKKIERSRQITNARMKKMKERDIIMKKVKEEVLERLLEVSRSPRYPDLIRFLIVQGLATIAENKVTIQCRKEDSNIVKKRN